MMYLLTAVLIGSVSAYQPWCNPIPGFVRQFVPACSDDPGDTPNWCSFIPESVRPLVFGCNDGTASSHHAPALEQHSPTPMDTLLLEVAREKTASSVHWCKTIAASVRATIPACADQGDAPPVWCNDIPAAARQWTFGCTGASSVMAPADSVVLAAPTVQTSNALFGGGDKAPGETCAHQFMGSECQSGSMCMVLQGKSFCTALNSLPMGMECANTGNAVQTFCRGGMTCCNGVCADAFECAAGKAAQIQKITATAFEIYQAYQSIAGGRASNVLAAPASETVMLADPTVQTSNFITFGSGGKTAGEDCSWQFMGSECASGLMCMELAGRGICTALGSLPENMECANTGNAVQTFCKSGMTCCTGQCTDLVACAQGKWDQAQKIIASAQEVYAAAQAIGVV